MLISYWCSDLCSSYLVADADPRQRGASCINRAPGPDRPETAAEIRQPPGRDQRVLAAVRNPRHRAMPRVRNARDLVGARGHRRAAIEDVDEIFKGEALILQHQIGRAHV